MPPLAAVIPAVIGAGASIGGSLISASAQNRATNKVMSVADREQALKEQIYNQIQPFASYLMQMGVDPVKFLSTPQGQALLGGMTEPIGKETQAARANLINSSMGAGFAPQSGVSAGPLAALEQAGVANQSAARRDLIGQALQLGVQGSNILQGQQAQFNPTSLFQSLLMNPPQSLLGSGLSALGVTLPGLIGSIKQAGAQKTSQQLFGTLGGIGNDYGPFPSPSNAWTLPGTFGPYPITQSTGYGLGR